LQLTQGIPLRRDFLFSTFLFWWVYWFCYEKSAVLDAIIQDVPSFIRLSSFSGIGFPLNLGLIRALLGFLQ